MCHLTLLNSEGDRLMPEQSEQLNRVTKLRRRCFALAKEVFGNFPVGGVAAYDYFLRKFVKEKLGKDSRKDLDESEWEMVLQWLEELRMRMLFP